jgi:hypothetical protein
MRLFGRSREANSSDQNGNLTVALDRARIRPGELAVATVRIARAAGERPSGGR